MLHPLATIATLTFISLDCWHAVQSSQTCSRSGKHDGSELKSGDISIHVNLLNKFYW